MKTKNIFKTVALAMLMPAMLLTTACSNDDDVVNNAANTENTINKGYALPVTVNVTRQGDEATTRAEFNKNGDNKLTFSDGDKLFVEGSHIEADRFAGVLTWQSGETFSGTIYTESPYGGTIDDLLNGKYATLLPAGYESYDYLEIIDEGYEARLGENAYNSFATSKKLGVEQLSFEHGEYNSGTGFVLEPRNAILNFTITGLTASTNVTATLSDDDDWTPDIEGEVTTDGSGNATFAIGLEGSSDLNEFSLTVAGNPISLVSSSKVLTAGKIYNITRAITDLSTINANYTASNGVTLTGTLGANKQISIADGATVILNGVSINADGTWSSGDYAGITCLGDATIILSGTNTVTGFDEEYPGIYVPGSKTVTIKGSGSLTASSNGWGAGIGGGWEIDCGNIEIQGGTITATGGTGCAGIGAGNGGYNVASCGTITISGGTITATGGDAAAGIGSGTKSSCGNITITSGVTHVTATKGDGANSIGAGANGSCGTVTIEDESKVTKN